MGWEGQTIEEVAFARDEMANIVWAIERQVTGTRGQPIRRYEQWSQRPRPAPPAASPSTAETHPASYRLISEVPGYWFPLEVEAINGGAETQLRLRLYNPERRPLGALLRPNAAGPFVLREEEVTRAGVRVRRAYQYARWVDGSHHIWIGRRKEIGHGEASSGLRFDYLET